MVKKKPRAKEAFVNAFLDLLEVKLFDSISIKEIAKKADYSTQSFYRFFKDKYDLCDRIIKDAIDGYNDAVNEVADRHGGSFKKSEDIYDLRISTFSYVIDNKRIFQAFYRYPCFMEFSIQFINYLLADKVLPVYYFSLENEEVNMAYLNYLCSYIHYANLSWWITSGYKESPQDMAKLYYSVLENINFINFDSKSSS